MMKDVEFDEFKSLLLSIDQKLQIIIDTNFMKLNDFKKFVKELNSEPLGNTNTTV